MMKGQFNKEGKNLYDDGWKYITCYETPDGKLCPMGEAKSKDYAVEIAKRHKHILCRLVKLTDYGRDQENSDSS